MSLRYQAVPYRIVLNRTWGMFVSTVPRFPLLKTSNRKSPVAAEHTKKKKRIYENETSYNSKSKKKNIYIYYNKYRDRMVLILMVKDKNDNTVVIPIRKK